MTHPTRSVLTLLQVLVLAVPARALAQPGIPPVDLPEATGEPPPVVPEAAPGASDAAGFESGFVAGQALYDRGEFLAAARTWTESARLLPEGPDNRDNRTAVFEYIAEAYSRALDGKATRASIEEALAVLDRYAAEFAGAHGADAPLGSKVAATRTALRSRLDAPPVITKPVPEGPPPAPRVPDAPAPKWRALAITGGLGLGLGVAGLALFTASAVQAKGLQHRFDDPARGCDLAAPSPECGEIIRAGRAAQNQAIAGAVIGSIGVITGATLIALAGRRRASGAAVTPRVGPGFAGLGLSGRF